MKGIDLILKVTFTPDHIFELRYYTELTLTPIVAYAADRCPVGYIVISLASGIHLPVKLILDRAFKKEVAEGKELYNILGTTNA